LTDSTNDHNYNILTMELREKVKQVRNTRTNNIQPKIIEHIKHLQQLTYLRRRTLMESHHCTSSLIDKATLYPELLHEIVGTRRQLGLYVTGAGWNKVDLYLSTNLKMNITSSASGLHRSLLVFLSLFPVLQYSCPSDIKPVVEHLTEQLQQIK
ncbi:unnamed protein product, partial [Didymodactylos carnosus]